MSVWTAISTDRLGALMGTFFIINNTAVQIE